MQQSFRYASEISRPASEVFDWHAKAASRARMLSSFSPARCFSHTFTVVPKGDKSCELIDQIEFTLPFWRRASPFLKKLTKFIQWRHRTLRDDLETYARYPSKPLKILISGSSGLIGSALISFLQAAGHKVVSLVRSERKVGPDSVWWDPSSAKFDMAQLEGYDVMIHLAGENIAGRRWSAMQKKRLFTSRCRDTWLLTAALLRLERPPKTLIAASASGFYGDRKSERLTEESSQGRGFIAELCAKWESSTSAAVEAGLRVVHPRFGYVLSSNGGMLAKMLPAFRLGLGGKLGDGAQIMPWVALDDILGALYHLMQRDDIEGAVNISAPNPVSQKVFAQMLAHQLHRPAFFNIPAAMLRTLLGEMADELLLTSENVVPEKLLTSGYKFRYESLEDLLKTVIL